MLLKQKEIRSLSSIVSQLSKSLKKRTTIFKHYNPTNDDFFYHFSKLG